MATTTLKKELQTYCELHWWNNGTKTSSFKGPLKDLLFSHKITFTKSKSEIEGYFYFRFKSAYDITYKVRCNISDFPNYAKQFIQMECVRMGDKITLYVNMNSIGRHTVTVNF